MTIYIVWWNRLFITITGSVKNLEMFPEIENTVYDPKSWAINLIIVLLYWMFSLKQKSGDTATVLKESVFRSRTICSANFNF